MKGLASNIWVDAHGEARPFEHEQQRTRGRLLAPALYLQLIEAS